jgi:hypothetical protein
VTKREALNAIYERLQHVLAHTDFKLQRKAEGFVRSIPGGWQEVGVPFYIYGDRFEFSIVLSIRLDEIQRITNQFSGSPVECHHMTVTTIIQPEYFLSERVHFIVRSEEDVQKSVAAIAPTIADRIVPFLDDHKDVEALDRAMNQSVPSADTSHHPYRGMSAITVAKLAGNPHFEQLVSKYASEMSRMPATDQEKFNRFADYLRSYSPPPSG